MQYKSVDDFMNMVKRRDPHQTEFLQAVQEVMDSLWPFLQTNPRYSSQGLLERLAVGVGRHVSVLLLIICGVVHEGSGRTAGVECRHVDAVVHEANEIGTGEDPCQPVGGDGGE